LTRLHGHAKIAAVNRITAEVTFMSQDTLSSTVPVAADRLPRGLSTAHPVTAVQAKGAWIHGSDGRRYLDFVAGIGTLNTGHGHPRVMAAAKAQIDQLVHTAFQVVQYGPYLELVSRLLQRTRIDGPLKGVLFTTGAEAVENAVKIARSFTGRPGVISFSHGFHGRTLLGLTLTGRSRPYKQDFGPLAGEVFHAPWPYGYRGWTVERALAAFNELLLTQTTPDRVAAVIIEPVAGEGGFLPAPPQFLQELRRITGEHGIMLIADEIQTGFGRTGRFFAFEHSGVQPDLVTAAKGIAGGFPLSGVLGRAEVMDAPLPGGLGGTFGGNAVACAAGLAVLDVLDDESLLERARLIGARLEAEMNELQSQQDSIGEVRALGAMVAIELVRDRVTREPAAELASAVLAAARERGLLLIRAGLHDNGSRFLPPLNLDDATLGEGLAIFREAFTAAVETAY
jgi:4-aminobutyrate aminotransferase/(S)-3-amino-2-methylpropionate transaminase